MKEQVLKVGTDLEIHSVPAFKHLFVLAENVTGQIMQATSLGLEVGAQLKLCPF